MVAFQPQINFSLGRQKTKLTSLSFKLEWLSTCYLRFREAETRELPQVLGQPRVHEKINKKVKKQLRDGDMACLVYAMPWSLAPHTDQPTKQTKNQNKTKQPLGLSHAQLHSTNPVCVVVSG